MSAPLTYIYKGCDHRLSLKSVRTIDGQPLNAGTVTYSLYKASDEIVIATVNLPYIGGSSGNYWATLDKTVTAVIEPDVWYTIKIVYSDVDGNDDEEYVFCYGRLRH